MCNANKEKQELLWSLLGDLPEQSPISCEKILEEKREHFILEKLVFDLNRLEPVPAIFIRPNNVSSPVPAILYNHVHGGEYHTGKEELIKGWRSLQDPPYAEEFARRGWAALAIDAWNFGERHNRTESSLFKEMLWNGRVLWGMMVYDTIRALDYLCSRKEIDPERIATLGMSMGSTMAWWIAALDERIKVCVDICCLTDFVAFMKKGLLDKHGLYYYVPGLLKHFTTASINELIAPRAHLSLAGLKDALTPPEGLDEIDRRLQKKYAQESAPRAWKLVREDCSHEETPKMRNEILKWLDEWL